MVERQPCLREFLEELDRPSGEVGPVQPFGLSVRRLFGICFRAKDGTAACGGEGETAG